MTQIQNLALLAKCWMPRNSKFEVRNPKPILRIKLRRAGKYKLPKYKGSKETSTLDY